MPIADAREKASTGDNANPRGGKPRPGDRTFVGSPQPSEREHIGLGSVVLSHECKLPDGRYDLIKGPLPSKTARAKPAS